tara:strand:- start:62 stop:361 length:300 start_codon:yes stop_codon:yes gene_type:complete
MVVAKSMTIGKEEKSSGLAVFIATMIMSRASMIFIEKNMSNINAGIGRIRNARIRSTTEGTAKELHRKFAANCRISVNLYPVNSIKALLLLSSARIKTG